MTRRRIPVVLALAAMALAVVAVALGLQALVGRSWQVLPSAGAEPEAAAGAGAGGAYTALIWDSASRLRLGRQDGGVDLWDIAAGTVAAETGHPGATVLRFLPVPPGFFPGTQPVLLLADAAQIAAGTSPFADFPLREGLGQEARFLALADAAEAGDLLAVRDGLAVIAGPPGAEVLILGEFEPDNPEDPSLITVSDLTGGLAEIRRLDANLSAVAAAPGGETLVLGHADPGRVQAIGLPLRAAEVPAVAELPAFAFWRDSISPDVLPGGADFTAGPAVAALAAAGSGIDPVVAAVAEDGQMVILRPSEGEDLLQLAVPPQTPGNPTPEALPQLRYQATRMGLPPPALWAVPLDLPTSDGQLYTGVGMSSDGRLAGVLPELRVTPEQRRLLLVDTASGKVSHNLPLPRDFAPESLPAFVEIASAVSSVEFWAVMTGQVGSGIVHLCFDAPRDRFVYAETDALWFVPRPPAAAEGIAFVDLPANAAPLSPVALICDPTDGAVFLLSAEGTVFRYSANGQYEWSQELNFLFGMPTLDARALGFGLSLPAGTADLLVSAVQAPGETLLILDRRSGTITGHVQRREGWGDVSALATASARVWGVINGEELVLNDGRSGWNQWAALDEGGNFRALPSGDGGVAGFYTSTGRDFALAVLRLADPADNGGAGWQALEQANDGTQLQPLPPVAPDGLRLSADGGRVLVRSREGQVFLGRTLPDPGAAGLTIAGPRPEDPAQRCCLRLALLPAGPAVAAELLPDGSAAVLALADHRLVLADADTGALRGLGQMAGPVRALAVAPGGAHLAVLAEGGPPVVLALPGRLARLMPETLVHRPWLRPAPPAPRHTAALPDLPAGTAPDVILAAAFPPSSAAAASALTEALQAAGQPARLGRLGRDLLVLVPAGGLTRVAQFQALARVRTLSAQTRAAGLHALSLLCPALPLPPAPPPQPPTDCLTPPDPPPAEGLRP